MCLNNFILFIFIIYSLDAIVYVQMQRVHNNVCEAYDHMI